MANGIVLFPNRGDVATLSGGAWQLPLANLQDPIIQRVARSQDLAPASTQMTIALDKPRASRAVVLVNSSATVAARKRVRVYSPQNDVLWQTGTDASDGWENVYPRERPTRQMQWRDENWWSGRPIAEDIEGSTQSIITVFPALYYASRITIEFDDPNNPAGYLDFGRLYVSGQYQPSINYDIGAQLSFDALTTSARSMGGTLYSSRKKHPRVMQVSWGFLPEAEIFSRVYEIQRRAGTDAEVFWIGDPDDLLNMQRLSWLGHLRDLPPMSRWTAAFYGAASFVIEELV